MSTVREQYSAKIKHQLDALNANIDALEAKAHEAGKDARDAYHAQLRDMRHQSTLATAQMAKLKSASEDSWDTVVAEMGKLSDALKHSFNYFKTQI